VRIHNVSQDRRVCSCAVLADTFGKRARGLLFRRAWDGMDGMLLSPCASVHTCGMRMVIDVCFLDAAWRVVNLVAGLSPWRTARGGRGSRHTLELPHGALERTGVVPGDQLGFSDS